MTEKSGNMDDQEKYSVEPVSPKKNAKTEVLEAGSKILESVNRDLLVPKLAFFFFFMATGAYLPYLGVFYKQLWLNARQSGLLLGVRPFIKMLCSPVWGMVTDVCNKPKWILLVSIFGAMVAHFSQSVVSPFVLPCYPETNGTIDGLNYTNGQIGFPPSVVGDEAVVKNRRYSEPAEFLPNTRDKANIKLTLRDFDALKSEETSPFDIIKSEESKFRVEKDKRGESPHSVDAGSKDVKNVKRNFHEEEIQKTHSEKPSVNSGKTEAPSPARPHTANKAKQEASEDIKGDKRFITKSKQRPKPLNPENDFRILDNHKIFVTLLVIVILGELVAAPAPMLTDSGTLELLSGREHEYGRQRLFGSLGWGIGSLFSGAIVAALNTCPFADAINYVACFYVFATAMVFDFVTCFFFKFPNGDSPPMDAIADKGFLQGLKVFATLKNSGFIFTLFFLGYSHSLQLSFLLWFLQDIGGTPLLFALILTINSLAEVLTFFVATYLVQKLGNDVVIYLGLGCYGVRFLMYSYVENPWFVLPLELLQGITYGGVWTASVSYVGSQPGKSFMLVRYLVHTEFVG